MIEEDEFTKSIFVVIGLGLIGGSLALRLKGRKQTILAVDPDPFTREYAVTHKVVERISADPTELIPQADVIILSAPVDAILRLIPSLPDLHPGSPIVLDLGSTKVQICQALSELPPRFEVIGGHPICGKAAGGIRHADPNIFQGSTFAYSLLTLTQKRTQRFAEWLAQALGADAIWVESLIHDRWVASTSHLPYLISSALSLITPAEALRLVGPGFASSTRLAGSPSSVMVPILETNREFVLKTITRFREQLGVMEAELRSENYSELGSLLDRAKNQRDLLTSHNK